jgi:hypothetical protein
MNSPVSEHQGRHLLRQAPTARKFNVHNGTPKRWASDARYAHLNFPKPVKLGDNCIAWFEDELDAWAESRPRAWEAA